MSIIFSDISGESDRLLCERKDNIMSSKLEEKGELLLSIPVFQSAKDFIVGDDAEVNFSMFVQIGPEARNSCWIASEE